MEINTIWALAALAITCILFFSFEIHVPVWQFLRSAVFGSLSRFLLFVILGSVASYVAYQALRGYTWRQPAPQAAAPPPNKEVTENKREVKRKKNKSDKSRHAANAKPAPGSEAPEQESQK